MRSADKGWRVHPTPDPARIVAPARAKGPEDVRCTTTTEPLVRPLSTSFPRQRNGLSRPSPVFVPSIGAARP